MADPDSPAATVLRLMRERAPLHHDLTEYRLYAKRYREGQRRQGLGARLSSGTISWSGTWPDEDFRLNEARLIAAIDEKTDQIDKAMAASQGDGE